MIVGFDGDLVQLDCVIIGDRDDKYWKKCFLHVNKYDFV
jgi:hypothetical protein